MKTLNFLKKIKFSRYYSIMLFIGDITLINLSYYFSFLIRYNSLIRTNLQDSQTIHFLINFVWIFIFIYFKKGDFLRTDRIDIYLIKKIKHIILHVIIISFILFAIKFEDISRLRILYFYILFVFNFIVFRYTFIKILKKFRSKGYNFRTIIFIGFEKNTKKIINQISLDLTLGYKNLGYFDDIITNENNYLGLIENAENYILNNKINEVYFSINEKYNENIASLFKLCEKKMIRIKIIPNINEYTKLRKFSIDFYQDNVFFTLLNEPLENIFNRINKRFFDMFFSFFSVLFIFSWLFPIIYLIIKLSSKGPAFFIQERTGENGKTFKCFKFRTMIINTKSEELQATKNDQRITKVGKFLRSSNLDELPQIFNVLIGQMSIVGPRPHMLLHTKEFSELIDNYLVRHFAKPGITGWAQVNGFRGETKTKFDIEKRVEYDIWYIENWTFILDLKIIWKTIINMLKGEANAY